MFKIDSTWEILLITPNLYFTDTTLLLNLYCTNVPNVIKSCHSKLSFPWNQNIKKILQLQIEIFNSDQTPYDWLKSLFHKMASADTLPSECQRLRKHFYRNSYQMKFSYHYFWFHVCSEKVLLDAIFIKSIDFEK